MSEKHHKSSDENLPERLGAVVNIMALLIRGTDADPYDDDDVNAALLTVFDADMIDEFGDLACLEAKRRKPRTDLQVAKHYGLAEAYRTQQELNRFRKSVSKKKQKKL